MDVISLHQAGFKNAVASLGTALTTQHAGLLKRYTDEVILTYDSDEAGTRAALRAIPIVKAAGLSARVLHMDPYKDPDEFIKALGADAFQKRIDEAENSFLFEISVIEREYDMKDPEGKTAFYHAVAEKLMEFEVELERENYIEAVAARYHIGFDNLRKLVNRAAMKGRTPVQSQIKKARKNPEREDGMKKSQKLLLTWLIEKPGLYDSIRSYISADDFTEGLYCEAASLLFAQFEEGNVIPAKIINHFEEPQQQREAASLFNTTLHMETGMNMEKALKETVYRVRINGIAQRRALLEPTDIAGLQRSIQEERALGTLKNLHISFE